MQATETLCHLSVTDIKKRFCNIWFFCKKEACVNCGKEIATTLTWLPRVISIIIFLDSLEFGISNVKKTVSGLSPPVSDRASDHGLLTLNNIKWLQIIQQRNRNSFIFKRHKKSWGVTIIYVCHAHCNWDVSYVQSHWYKTTTDGAPFSPNQPSFGTPGQTKVSGDCQRDTTHEICCLAAECPFLVGS